MRKQVFPYPTSIKQLYNTEVALTLTHIVGLYEFIFLPIITFSEAT